MRALKINTAQTSQVPNTCEVLLNIMLASIKQFLSMSVSKRRVDTL
ncbi:hypothetical protein U14_02425 [Candidatus Moduliflexus flocculans]|uniref:Uncharacterized protein n=1 Tax=Candidatus Moduliflexus flocculans TaxID=1499966 RepID=A0A081BLB7_9BACT|nr:hypothetical protein U14_02425 [Candidatus Moduliflexus flocculans]